MADTQFRKAFLLFMVGTLTVGLLIVLRDFLLTIVVSAVMAGLLYPVYTALVERLRGRTTVAAGVTLVLMFVLIVGPVLGIISLVVSQAASITDNVRPVVERAVAEPTYLDRLLRQAPGYSFVAPYRQQILTTAGDVVNSIGSFLMTSLSNTTRGTVSFLFHFFIALYTMFFLLIDGPGMLRAVLDHLPLHNDEKNLLTERFMSVTRATIKGTIIIGVIQGMLAGAAMGHPVGFPDTCIYGNVDRMEDRPPNLETWGTGSPYERYVGRWSRSVALEFLTWLALPSDQRWGDVGCGTGALVGAILNLAKPTSTFAVDRSDGFIFEAKRTITDPCVQFMLADALALPWANASCDVTVSGLVINFVPDALAMVREMVRVTKSKGRVAAYVWDYSGGMQRSRVTVVT